MRAGSTLQKNFLVSRWRLQFLAVLRRSCFKTLIVGIVRIIFRIIVASLGSFRPEGIPTEGGIFDPTVTHIKKRTDRNRTDRTDQNRTGPTGTGPTGPTGTGPDRPEPDRLDRLEPDRPDRPEPDRPDRTGVTSAEQRLPIRDHGSRIMDQRSKIRRSWIMDQRSWIMDQGSWTLDLVLA